MTFTRPSLYAVHLRSDLRRSDGDGRSLQEPAQAESGHLAQGQCRRLPGKPSSSLEPRHRHGAHTKTGMQGQKVEVRVGKNRLLSIRSTSAVNYSALTRHM